MFERMCSVVSTNVGVKRKAIPPSPHGLKTVVSSDVLPYRRSSKVTRLAGYLLEMGVAHADKGKESLLLSSILLGGLGERTVCWVLTIPQSDGKSARASLFRQARDCSSNTEKSGRRCQSLLFGSATEHFASFLPLSVKGD